MRILFIADIVGRPGRRAVEALLGAFRQERGVDLVIANGENGSGGYGLTPETARELFSLGIDVLTSGNHIWDKREILPYLKEEPALLRPLNYPPGAPGSGVAIVRGRDGTPVAVLNAQGRVFMSGADCPFRTVAATLEDLRGQVKVIVLDFHAEATAEKVAMGWYLDGMVSAVVGTHTHVPTADERILPRGTAYITDAGLTGSLNSVIGMKKEIALQRFLLQMPQRFQPADDDLWLMGVLVDVDPATGRATAIERVRRPVAAEAPGAH